MRKLICILLASCCLPATASASEHLRADVTVDNANYNYAGSLGIRANTTAPASNVTATHTGADGPSFGTWELDAQSDYQFWNWSTGRVPTSEFDGTIGVSAVIDGVTHTISGAIPEDTVLAMQTGSWNFDEAGNLITIMDAVAGADFYNLWLWNDTTRSYAFEQSYSSTPLSTTISANLIRPGDRYNLYMMANNRFTAGENISGLYRSINGSFFTAPSVAGVPEPSTWAIMILGFGSIGISMRRGRWVKTPLQAT